MRIIPLKWVFALGILGLYSCDDPVISPGFEDMEQMTIYDYLIENEENFSLFLDVMRAGGVAKTMSAYNPDGIGYTLFLPDNNAMMEFIEEQDQFGTMDDLLANNEYVSALSKYHIINMGIDANEFPFGALPEYTLSGDFLTVNFIIETDTSYYKINNQAPVIKPNIELSNGFIHIISKTLDPITFTTYDWISQHPGYSIFTQAAELTGFSDRLDFNVKEQDNDLGAFTLLLESDSVFNRSGIFSLEDLISRVSPDATDYTSLTNPLYNFVGYHILEGSRFLDDFVGRSSNYGTYSQIPLNINGTGLDVVINKGKQVFDTLIVNNDTTIIDYVGFYYDNSNVLTQSGAIHFIDQVLWQQQPTVAIQTYEFYEEPLFSEFRKEAGSYLIEDPSVMTIMSFIGTDLFFIELGDEESSAWGSDYLYTNGDFVISYIIPRIIQGKYNVFLGAEAYNSENALVEVFIDGTNVGGLIDLSTGGSSAWPFAKVKLGTIDFVKYESHTIEVRSLIPGRFLWDYIRFEPFTN